MDLLFQINEQANRTIVEDENINKNIDLLTKYLSTGTDQLNEAISSWLTKVRSSVTAGKLNPAKKQDVAQILAALSAISNPDLADALDEKGDFGTLLYMAGGQEKNASNAALHRLRDIGRSPSLKTFLANALKVVEDPHHIEAFTKQIQTRIEPIMNKKLASERKLSANNV